MKNPPSQPDWRDQEIKNLQAKLTQLNAELNWVRDENADLQNENQELRNYIQQIQHQKALPSPSQNSTFLASPQDSAAKDRRKNTVTPSSHRGYNREDYDQIFEDSLLSVNKLKNGAIAVIVATLLIIPGFWLIQRFFSDSNSSPSQNSLSNSQTPAFPVRQKGNSSSATVPSSPDLPPTPQKTISSVENYQTGQNSLFKPSPALQNIVDQVVTDIQSKGFPTQDLSISLINVNQMTYAGNQYDATLRFPASVVKLFWMVALYKQINSGKHREQTFQADLQKMIVESDNEAGSRILDAITNTESRDNLPPEQLGEWLEKRLSINNDFQARYGKLNISQKTFPIPYLNYFEPEGTDKQMRLQGQHSEANPIRNQISTQQAALLMYDIIQGNAVPNYNDNMINLLTRNLNPAAWENIDPNQGHFNPVQAFFGEGLYEYDLTLVSKAGWTSQTRQEVAYINAPQYGTTYILAVFGTDKSYSESETIFPEIARLVFEKMRKR